MTDRNASLVLKTSDFTTDPNFYYGTVYNSFRGSANAKLSSLTWNNINLRTLLGDMYNDFDLFNICLNSISTSTANPTIDPSNDVKTVSVKISGLPFVNQTYNVKNSCNSSSTVIATFNFLQNQASTQYYYSNNIATFGKSQELCTITIEYYKIVDDTLSLPVSVVKTCGTTALDQTITMANTSNLVLGMYAIGDGIPGNSYITAIVPNTSVTVSNNALLNQAGVSVSFSSNFPNTMFVFDIFGIPKQKDNLNGTRMIL
jgi:hypothetical protein